MIENGPGPATDWLSIIGNAPSNGSAFFMELEVDYASEVE